MTGLIKLIMLLRRILSRFFSPSVEYSYRLRLIGLSSLWLAAWGVTWVGGNVWLSLAGGGLGTLGHIFSWFQRYRQPSTLRPALLASAVVGLFILMLSQVLEIFAGNWLPLGHFLIFVVALAAFDLRTRGGLYASLGLSGIVVFFASQQAFDPSFVIFVVGLVVLILAFLTVTFLEDGIRGAQVNWQRHRRGVLIYTYWIITTCAVFVLAGVAFWLMPRGEDALIRPTQIAILPYTGATVDQPVAPEPQPVPTVIPPSAGVFDDTASEPASTVDTIPEIPEISAPGVPEIDEIMLYVRSKVASYWRGQTLEKFDGRYWENDNRPEYGVRTGSGRTILYNRESFGRNNRIRYHQNFYVQADHPDSLFTGYRGMRILGNEGTVTDLSLERGDSYLVVSAQPQYTPETLRQDQSRQRNLRYTKIPSGSGRLRSLSKRITKDATDDFDRAERIVAHLSQEGNFDDYRPGDLQSSTTMNDFLFNGAKGSVLDYASATVMLARGAGLPSRMAIGYLPGVRDPLSGAYLVRESDAHAWAEVYFEKQGWVPFDSAPRTDVMLPTQSDSRFRRLFQAGVGERIYGAAKTAPKELSGPSLDLLQNPALYVGFPVLMLIVTVARWWFSRYSNVRRPGHSLALRYSRLTGSGRRELLSLYSQVEKLLRRKTGARRPAWQTVGSYASVPDTVSPDIQGHLSWFTRAVWQAAYNPGDLPADVVEEARDRLNRLKSRREW